MLHNSSNFRFNLFSELTALENVMFPKLMKGFSKGECKKRAIKLLALVGLEGRVNHKPSTLSGGEQQRVAIARALMNNPSILLADEPTGNLDSKRAKEIMQLLRKLNKDGQTIVMITHELHLGESADRIVWLRDGMIEGSK